MEDLDREKKTLIRTTAIAVLRNGTSFYEWLRNKRQSEPAYSFLFGGIGSNYYKWCLANSEEAQKEEQVEAQRGRVESVKVPIESNKVETKPTEFRRRGRSLSRSYSRSASRSRSVSRSPKRRSIDRSLTPRDRSESRKREEWARKRREQRVRKFKEVDRRRRDDSYPRRRHRSRSFERHHSPSHRRQRRESPPPRRHAADEAWGRAGNSRRSKYTEDDTKQGKMYAWSDGDEKQPVNPVTDTLREKLASMKQQQNTVSEITPSVESDGLRQKLASMRKNLEVESAKSGA